VLLAGGSLCMTVIQVVAGTMVQQSTADAMRGRISALGSAGQNGLAGIAAAATTALAARIGPGLAVGMLAAVTASPGPCCRGSPRIRGPVPCQGQSRALVIMGVAGGHRSGVMFLIVEILPKLAGYHGG